MHVLGRRESIVWQTIEVTDRKVRLEHHLEKSVAQELGGRPVGKRCEKAT